MTQKCRILCVDDHVDTGIMLKYLLSSIDYEVEIADCIEVATAISSQKQFDLIILDKRFPDGTGLELCQKIRQSSPQIPVVLYSGDAYKLHRDQAFSAGVTAFVAKPEIDKLLDTVNSLLAASNCGTQASVSQTSHSA